MNLEFAKQFLMDLGWNRSQPEDRIRAFREWQCHATPEDLAALDQWHQEWLMQQKARLDADSGMLDRNRDWLEQRVSASIQEEERALQGERDRDRTPIKHWVRWAAAAVVIGAIATGVWFSRHQSSPPAGTPIHQEGLIAGAMLTLSDGHKVSLESIPVGESVTDEGVHIIKLDSVTVSYDHQPGSAKGGSNTLTTAKGGQFRVILPDGSKVWLNSLATLTYPNAFTSADRTVQLSGEGYFEIQRDPAAPFMVRAPGMEVQVLGTSFDIMAYPDEALVRATLVDGSVVVSRGDKKKILQPGEQAIGSTGTGDGAANGGAAKTSAATGAFSIVKANMEEVLAWRRGEYRFRSTSIQPIMRQLARWYDVSVDYSGPVSKASFSGVMTRKELPAQLLEALEISGDVHFMIRGKNITVVAGPR